MEGNLHSKIDWASLIVGSKFIVFALFYFVFESNFPSTSSWGGRGFFALRVWGAYIWRGLFSEFCGNCGKEWVIKPLLSNHPNKGSPLVLNSTEQPSSA